MSESACRYCGECGRGHVCWGLHQAEIKKWNDLHQAVMHERDLAQKAFDEENTIRIAAEVERDEWIARAQKCGAAWDEEVTKLRAALERLDAPPSEADPKQTDAWWAAVLGAEIRRNSGHVKERDLAQKAFQNAFERAEKAEAEVKQALEYTKVIEAECARLREALEHAPAGWVSPEEHTKVQAEAAAMRGVLEGLRDERTHVAALNRIHTVLQPDAGNVLLAELEQWRVTALSREKLAEDTRAVLVHEREELKPLLAELTALRKVEEVAQMVVESEDPDALEEGDVIVEKGGDVWKAIEQAKREKKKP